MIGVVLILLLLLTSCAPQAVTGDETAGLETCPETILIEGFAFNPAACKVKVGSSLIFKNLDTVPHTATALFNAPVLFDTAELAQNAAFTVRFDQPARIPYHCEIHPSMTGTILVEP